MRIIVTFYEQSDHKVIEELGGTIVDELEFIPEVVIADIPDEETFEKILSHSQVLHAEKERWINVRSVTDSNPDFNNNRSWHLDVLNLKDYWDRGLTGKGMKIGLIDSAGVNSVFTPITDGIAYDSTVPDYYNAFSNHATACAGILIGRPVYTGNPVFKISGVAPDAQLYHAVVGAPASPDTVNVSYAFSAVNWMIGKKVDVISNSYSGDPTNRTASWDALTTAVYNAGIAMIVAGGNGGSAGVINDTTSFPANCPYTFAVSAMDTAYNRCDFSTTSSLIRLTLPGISVYTADAGGNATDPGTGYQSFIGTSASTPLMAGLYTLYKQALPGKTLQEILDIMQNNAKQLGNYTPGVRNLEFGYGLPLPSPEILRKPITIKTGLKLESHTTRIVTPVGNTTIGSLTDNFTAEVTLSMEATGGGFPIRMLSTPKTTLTTIWGLSLDSTASMFYSYLWGTPTVTSYSNSRTTFNSGKVSKDPHTWHLVYTFPNLYLYLNGVRVDAPFWASDGIGFGTGDVTNSYIEFGSFIKGTFNKGRLYNRILTASEIQSIVNNNLRITNGLVLEYIPKGNEVNTILDTSGNGFHGTIQGGATPTVKRRM
jgi:hypothetical protein